MRKSLLIWGGLVVLFLLLIGQVNDFGMKGQVQTVPYSSFLDKVDNGQVQSANLDLQEMKVNFTDKSGIKYMTYNPEALDPRSLIGELKKNNVTISSEPLKKESLLTKIFINLLPIFLLIGIFIFVSRQMQGGGKGGAFSFGKNKARLIPEDKIKVTFADVAGADEAKEEVKEVVDFLKDPTKFSKLGGQIPRGILMVGPPGTGKTLLARAVAGEAKVPFYTISGSDFVEMFVGVGASRVRNMFEEAKKNAPCIIFIDEIDAVGRKRGSGMGGGHDEREQTLNQMLVEMDGFDGNEGVIVIAATNRADVLDPALLRPGRFDRQVVVSLPDIKGREQILKVHMKKKPIATNVSAYDIARGTPGFSGAELANLVNEAALFAARKDSKEIAMKDMENAKDKILMGPERKSAVMSSAELEMTAYHEAGHCIIGRSVPSHDPVYKVTIIPRGRALGVTMFLPERDKYSQSKEALESSISTLYGGRLAEELIYGKDKVSTGASNDIKVATNYARDMVTKWGLSEKLGPLLYEEDGQGAMFGGGAQQQTISNETALLIDQEMKSIIDRNYVRANKILTENMDILHAMAKALLKYETIDEKQIDDLMERRPVRDPEGWDIVVDDGPQLPPKIEAEPIADHDAINEKNSDESKQNPVGKVDE